MSFQSPEEADPELVFAVELSDYRARVERVAVIDGEAFDWNCPPHITPRFTLAELEARENRLREPMAGRSPPTP